jgi:hypothetical protein
MAVANGYGKVATSGSVFMYDVGDIINSYRGEPTTNIWGIETGFDVNQRSGWSMPYAYNGAITDSVYTSGTWNGNRIWEVLHTAGTSGYAGFESWRLCVNQPTAGNSTYSTTRRVAIKICVLEGSITDMALHSGGGNAGHDGANWTPIPESQVPRDCPIKTGWYQFLADGSWGSNSVGHCVGLGFISYNRVKILTTEPMYYPSDHLIPFTGYQRSATQGLLPLVGSSTINLSNVSFNSAAQITFDGTDDLIDIDTNFGTLSAYTFEYVSYSNSAGNMPISSRTSTAFYKYGAYSWRYTHGGVGDEFYHTYGNDTGWAHWVITYDGSVITVYENGVSKGTKASSGTADFSGGIRIGSWTSSASYTWDGQIPILKMYNRALSFAEVRQNYNKYKTRFNLP